MSSEELQTGSTSGRVFEAQTWIVVIHEDGLYRQQYLEEKSRLTALDRLAAVESPKDVFGWSGQKILISQLRRVEWVPDARTVLIWRGWWRDPWRLTLADNDAAERLFHSAAAMLPDAREPTTSRVGPHDLEMDPQILIGVILTLAGFAALLGGALDGVGQAPMPVFEWLFRLVGRAIGIVAVISVGVLVLASGVLALVWWSGRRPTKLVIVRGRRRA